MNTGLEESKGKKSGANGRKKGIQQIDSEKHSI